MTALEIYLIFVLIIQQDKEVITIRQEGVRRFRNVRYVQVSR